MGLLIQRKQLTKQQVAVSGNVIVSDLYRSVLLDSCQMKQTNKRMTMLQSHLLEYNWLHRHDPEWLDKHFPRKRRVWEDKFNLTDYDSFLANEIKKVAIQLKLTYPRQIRKNTILRQLLPLDRGRLNLMKDRLPKCCNQLQQEIEDLESYLIRRLKFIVLNFKKKGYHTVTFKTVLNYSKLYNQCGSVTKIRIEEMLKQFNLEM